MDVEQPARRRADQHDSPGDLVLEAEIRIAEDLRRRDHLPRPRRLIVKDEVAARRRRHAEIADAKAIERVAVAGIAQRHQRRHPERQPQRFDREARIEPRAIAPEQRHPAHRAHRILIVEAEPAEPGCRYGERRQRCNRPADLRQRRSRIAPRHRDAGLRVKRKRRRFVRERKPQHGIAAPQRLGKLGVIVGRQPVRLGEQHVEADRGGAQLRQSLGHLRHQRARPRPLPVLGERGLVDIDDPHRAVGCGARQQPLLEVEAHVADG